MDIVYERITQVGKKTLKRIVVYEDYEHEIFYLTNLKDVVAIDQKGMSAFYGVRSTVPKGMTIVNLFGWNVLKEDRIVSETSDKMLILHNAETQEHCSPLALVRGKDVITCENGQNFLRDDVLAFIYGLFNFCRPEWGLPD